jgi:hypothetical protein
MLHAFKSRNLGMMACLGVCLLAAPARADVVVNRSVPLNFSVFVPCAASGAGESIDLTGDLHVRLAFSFSSSGGLHAQMEAQPQNLSGVGETSGLEYHATGVDQTSMNFHLGMTSTFTSSFRITGPDADSSYLVHQSVHVTLNPSGSLTASADNFSVECR